MIEEKIIYGKKVVLFPFVKDIDLPLFVKLHRGDKSGNMGRFCLKEMTEEQATVYMKAMLVAKQLFIWTVTVKDGKESKTAGFIYLSNITSINTNVSGIMDIEFAKGLSRRLRKGKLTVAEDATRTLIDACFKDFGFERVETDVLKENRIALFMDKKIGFVKEGVLRNYLKVDDDLKDIVILSILKEEWISEVKIQSRDTEIQRTS